MNFSNGDEKYPFDMIGEGGRVSGGDGGPEISDSIVEARRTGLWESTVEV